MSKGKLLRRAGFFAALSVSLASTASDVEPTPDAAAYFEKEIRPLLASSCFQCHGPAQQLSELRLDSREAFDRGGKSGPIIDRDNPDASAILLAVERGGAIKMPPDGPLPDDDIQRLREWVRVGAPWPESQPVTPAAESETPEQAFDAYIDEMRGTHWSFQPVESPAQPTVSDSEWVATLVDAFVLARLDAAGIAHAPKADARALIRRLSFDLTGLPPDLSDVNAFAANPTQEAYAALVEKYLASPHYGERWGRHWLDVARYADTKGYIFQEERAYPYSYTYRDYVIRAFNDDRPYDQFLKEQLAADLLPLGEDKRPLAALGFLTLGRRFLNNIHDITDDRIDVVTRGLQGLTVSCARCHNHKYDPIASKDYYALYGVFRSTYEPNDPNQLPLIEDPDPESPAYQEFLKIEAHLDSERFQKEREVHVALLNETRTKTPEYLRAAHASLSIDDQAAFRIFAQEQGTRFQVLARWKGYLKRKLEEPDVVWRPYSWFSVLTEENFASEAPKVVDHIRKAKEGDGAVNARVRAVFEGAAPTTMDEVVNRYVELLTTVDAEWRDQLAAHAQIKVQQPNDAMPDALKDPASETVRKVLYAQDAPANVPAGKVYDFSEAGIQGQIRQKRLALANHRATHPGRPDRAQVLRDSEKPFDPFVFNRGKPGDRGENVPRRFLRVLSAGEPQTFGEGSGRRELAEAIASADNPLTARVYVNRVWQQHFGAGIVRTSSDFGTRGDAPSHPQLLDYLARYFMDQGWSTKALHRQIVLSNTYQQSTIETSEQLERDPENRLLSRQNRQRLDYESFRDALLAITGELDGALGGPPEPAKTFEKMRRRTVYAEVVRGEVPGEMKAFDFASPDAHTAQRIETIVPQQALYLMNSPFVNERARVLGASVAESELPESGRVDQLFQAALQRTPSEDERNWALGFVNSDAFQGAPEPDPPPAWQYGCGALSPERDAVTEFHEFAVFDDHKRWHPEPEVPGEKFGWALITRDGGHPGRGDAQSAIRRWTAPRDGLLSVSGELSHNTGKGNGVIGYIIASNTGAIGSYRANNSKASTAFEGIPVKAGETIDFVLHPDGTPGWDSFVWRVQLELDGGAADAEHELRTVWNSATDFRGPRAPAPEPLGRWAQLAQAIICTNEFMYVD